MFFTADCIHIFHLFIYNYQAHKHKVILIVKVITNTKIVLALILVFEVTSKVK